MPNLENLFVAAAASLLLAAAPEAHAAAQGPELGSSPVWSDVQFRGLDSFWRGNASHVDLYNVKLESTTAGNGLKGAVLKVYVENAEQLAAIQKRVEVDQHLLPYKRASMPIDVPALEFVEGAQLDPATCDTVWDGSTFFDAPWYHNVFHLHAKNILPTALVIATAPPLVSGVGACTELPCKEQLPRRTLFHFSEPSRGLMLANVQLALFDEVHSVEKLAEGKGSHCFRHINWGYGGELTSVDGYLPDYVHEARVITQAVRTFAINEFVKDAAARAELLPYVKPENRATAAPRVLWISRQPKDTKGMVQTGRNRWIQDPDVVTQAWVNAGAVVDECCDWNKVTMDSMMVKIANADIVYGLHGAGLANAFYARKHNVLVEFVGNYGGDSLFYTRVAAATYGDWLRLAIPRSNTVGPTVAKYAAECAIALWRDSPEWETVCKPPSGGFEGKLPDLVRTTHDMLKVGDAEELPVVPEIANCDASPRCRMAQLTAQGGDMMAVMKAMSQRPKPVAPERGAGAPGRRRHKEL